MSENADFLTPMVTEILNIVQGRSDNYSIKEATIKQNPTKNGKHRTLAIEIVYNTEESS